MPEGPIIRVAIVDDDSVMREGLRCLINLSQGFSCSATFGAAEPALSGLLKTPVDVLLLDIGLPGMRGSEAVSLFHERSPSLKILMLTVFADEATVFRSICNGASGYLLKSMPPAQLLEAIAAAYAGGCPLSPSIARQIVSLFQKAGPLETPTQALSPQEQRVLSLLSEGYSYQGSAANMDVSINTVRNHVRSIYEKLHVHSKSEAVKLALRQGLIR